MILTHPPPWNTTKTGRLPSSDAPGGITTLTYKQSSPCAGARNSCSTVALKVTPPVPPEVPGQAKPVELAWWRVESVTGFGVDGTGFDLGQAVIVSNTVLAHAKHLPEVSAA